MYIRKQVEIMIGIPAGRIKFFTDQGLLPMVDKDTGRGRERKYSQEDVFRLALIKEMSETGIVLSKIREILSKAFELKPCGLLTIKSRKGTSCIILNLEAIYDQVKWDM